MICFFSENGHSGPVDRHSLNLRTEFAWQLALDATHENINQLTDSQYEVGVLIIPKGKEVDIDTIRSKCKTLAVMQEGPRDYYLQYSIENQIKYLSYLNQADILLCHNKCDKQYYGGMFDKPTYVLRTLLVEESLSLISEKKKKADRSGVMVGGTFCEWYGGRESTVVAQEFNEPKISIPSMGRLKDGETEANKHINYLPFQLLSNFLKELNEYKYAVHLMPTYAAGTFALNCARLGVPCIGYKNCDTQNNLFPKLSVDEGDVVAAKALALKLLNKVGFYEHVVESSLKTYEKLYSEENWLRHEGAKALTEYDT